MLKLISLALAASCPPLIPIDLSKHLRPNGDTKIIFFASWCADCRESLVKPQPEGSIFISAFDERSAAEQAIARFRPQAVCFTGEGIAERYGINYLPATVTVGPDGQVR